LKKEEYKVEKIQILTKGGWDLDEAGGISTETEVPSSLVTGNLKEWGEGEPKRGKYSKLSSLNHFTISGDARKSKFPSFLLSNQGKKLSILQENILVLIF
jgi:hypothetical protein